MGKEKKMKIKLEKGLFYNTNLRGVVGLNWGANPHMDISIRECKHSIGIPASLLLRIYESDVLEAEVSNLGMAIGIFSIPSLRLRDWVNTNGLYTTSTGKRLVAVPLSLWRRAEEEEGRDKQLQLI